MWVENQTSFIAKDWPTFRREFLAYFREDDTEQRKYSKVYLQAFVSKNRKQGGDVKRYLTQFDVISERIAKAQGFEDTERSLLLIRGLPKELRDKIIRKYDLDLQYPSEGDAMVYTEICAAAKKYIRKEQRAKASLEIMDASDDEEASRKLQKPQQSFQQQPASQKPIHQPTVPLPGQGYDHRMQEIESSLKALTLQTQGLLSRVDRRNDYRYEPDRRGPSNNLGVNPPLTCWTCGGPHASRPEQCAAIRDMQGRGIMHYNLDGKMALGTMENPGPQLRVIPGKLNQESFQEQYERWKAAGSYSSDLAAPVAPAAPVNSIAADLNGIPSPYPAASYPTAPVHSIGASLIGSSPDYTALDESDEEFDGPVGAVNAADARVPRRRRNHDVAQTKSTTAGRFQPRVEEVLDDDVMQDGGPEDSQTQQAISIATPARPSVPVKKTRGPQDPEITRQRSELFDTVMKRIWETEVTLSVGELLGTAPKIRAGIGKGVSIESINQRLAEVFSHTQSNLSVAALPDEIQQKIDALVAEVTEYHQATGSPFEADSYKRAPVKFQDARLVNDDYSLSPPREYSRDLLYVTVTIAGRSFRACIDPGSSVNIIRREIAEALALRMRLKPRLKLVPVDGGDYAVGACVESLPIGIHDIVTESHTMVGDGCTNDVLLGRIWSKDALLQTSERLNGRVVCTVYSRDRKKKVTFEAYNPRNGGSYFEDQLWPEDYEPLDGDSLKVSAGV
jgi:hypothetical protein